MRSELYDLRLACRDYPRSDLVIAVDAALQGLGIDDNERSGLASLIAGWLLDEESEAAPPPLPPQAVDRVRIALRRRRH